MNNSLFTYAIWSIFVEACFTGAIEASFCVCAAGMNAASSVVNLTFVVIYTCWSVSLSHINQWVTFLKYNTGVNTVLNTGVNTGDNT